MAARMTRCGQRGEAEQVGQQRDQRADRERGQRRARRRERRRQLLMVDAEFLADVDAQRLLGLPRQLPGDLIGQLGIHAAHLVQRGELDLLAMRVVLELEPLLLDLRGDQLVLRGDRHELARRHGERARGESGEPRQHDGLLGQAAAADAGDQRDVGDQSVHGAEHRGAQPAAGHVAVLMHVWLGVARRRMSSPAACGPRLVRLSSGIAGCHTGVPCCGPMGGLPRSDWPGACRTAYYRRRRRRRRRRPVSAS